jgi:RNA polymerase sigma factor (sigma-70 family)
LEESFSDLIRRAKAGEEGARAELLARHQHLVLAAVRRRLAPALRRRFDSMDVAQSVFEDVLRDLPRFEERGEQAFRHWLYLKTENKIRDAWRRRLGADGRPRENTMGSTDPGPAAPGPGPATEAGDIDDASRLRDAVAALPDAQREIIALRDESGLAFAAIAKKLGLAGADAARMRYARALLALRRNWEPR